jgi:hypothetical protein
VNINMIVAIIGIIGIVIAAILSSAGYLYRVRLESKKSAKKVLYFLLEIRHAIIISSMDPDVGTEIYFEHCVQRMRDKGFPLEKEEVEKIFSEQICEHFKNVISTSGTDIEKRLVIPFEAALLDMATINPVLAYKLRGKEKIEKLLSHINTHQEAVKEKFIPMIEDDWVKDVVLETSRDVEVDVERELYGSLDDDILLLAKYCGHSDYRNSKAALITGLNNSNKYDYSEFDKYIDMFMDRLIEAATKR